MTQTALQIWEWICSLPWSWPLIISLFSLCVAGGSLYYSWTTRNDPFRFTMAHERILSCKSLLREMADVSALLNKTERDSEEFRTELRKERQDVRRCWAYEMLILDDFGAGAITRSISPFFTETYELCFGELPIQDEEQFARRVGRIHAGYYDTGDTIRELLGIGEGDGEPPGLPEP